MKVLVTGGNGFLGRAVVSALKERGHEVTSGSRTPSPELEKAGVRDLRLDVRDRASVERAVRGQEAVVHTAARVGIFGPRREFFRTNVEGTRHLLEASLRGGVRRFVYTSTPSVCFDGKGHVRADESTPHARRFLAAYPESKAVAETLVLAANGSRLATCALRPHLIFGPGDPHLIPRLVARGRAGRLVRVGTETNEVSLCWIENAARAHLAAVQRLTPGAACAGKAYFVAQEDPVVLWEWIDRLFERLGVPPVRRRLSRRAAYALGAAFEVLWTVGRLAGEPPLTRFLALQLATSHSYDTSALRRELGYEEAVGMAQATERLIEHLSGAGPRPLSTASGSG